MRCGLTDEHYNAVNCADGRQQRCGEVADGEWERDECQRSSSAFDVCIWVLVCVRVFSWCLGLCNETGGKARPASLPEGAAVEAASWLVGILLPAARPNPRCFARPSVIGRL